MAENDSISTDQLLPFEREAGKSPAETRKGILDALESEHASDEPGTEEPTDDAGDEPDESESDEEEIEEASDEDEPEDGEESEDEDEEPESEPVYEVKVNGKTEKVSLREALDGYQRQSDYSRSWQALADEKKQFQAEATQVRQARDQYAERLEALALTLKDTQPKEPDWDKLRAENPTEYAVQRADFARFKEKQAEVEAEQRRVHGERLADWNKEQEKLLQAETEKLLGAIPEWKDETKASADKAKLVDYATGTLGYSNEELANMMDHRALLVIRKAMLYDEGQTKGKDKIRDKVKPAAVVLKPGHRERSPERGPKSAVKRARQTLRKTGRTEDAAAYIATLLGQEG